MLTVCMFSGACDDKSTASSTASETTAASSTAVKVEPPPPDPHRFDYKKPTVAGKVAFAGLENGAKVKGQNIMGMIATEVQFVVEGMTVAEEGPVKVNTGHFVLITDGEPIEESQLAKDGGKVRKFGKGETKGVIPLPEGKHTLTLQFVDGRDRSYGKDWSSTIQVTASAK